MSKQQAILDFIIQHNKQNGYPPTLREIGEGVELKSPSSVFRYLKKLEMSGAIKRSPESVRAIEVIGEHPNTDEVTVVEEFNDLPEVILWRGRRFQYDPLG